MPVDKSFNKTEYEYPERKTIHGLFEEQVEKTPQKTAMVFSGKGISYEKLNEAWSLYLEKLAANNQVTSHSNLKQAKLSVQDETNFEVKDDFVKFARENIEFLKKYEKDLEQNKSVEDIAGTIHQSPEKVAEITGVSQVEIQKLVQKQSTSD